MPFRIHKEGFTILIFAAIALFALNYAIQLYLPILFWPLVLLSLVFYGLIVQFFRNPIRKVEQLDDNIIYAPADGRVCVIEETVEAEYFQEKRLQVSIFMSPLNVHVNRNPVSGKVNYFRYHPGKYLVAWNPKSSTENERTTAVYQLANKTEILMRQIAGAVARRIRWYIKEGDPVVQGQDMGFIKFGSRVDLFLPIGTKVEVSMDQQVKGNQTIIGRLKS